MDIEKMTTTMQQTFGVAQSIAVMRKHQEIDLLHLWKVFLTPNHFARGFYQSLGINTENFESFVDQELDNYPTVEGSNVQYGQGMSQNLYRLLTEADKIRTDFQDDFLSTEIVLLALMKLKNHSLTNFLTKNGLTEKIVKNELENI